MKHFFNRLAFIFVLLLIGVSGLAKPVTPVYGENVTVKLVLGKNATLTGYVGSNDATIFHENVVTYTAASNTTLPTPTKQGTTFVSWVYAQNSELVRVSKMPLSSGAIYFAYWEGDGSLATGSATSSLPSSSSSQTSSVTSSSSVVGEPVTIYLNTGGATLWNQADAQFYIYTFNPVTKGVWPGTRMSLVSGDIYTATIEDASSTFIFSRFNPSYVHGESNPDAEGMKWNQTENLVYAAGQNLYTITGWGAATSTGSWSVYST